MELQFRPLADNNAEDAPLLVGDDLKQDLQKTDKGTITVYALNDRRCRRRPSASFADGLAALDKRRTKP